MAKANQQRLNGGKGTIIALTRFELYKSANARLKSAYEQGFWIECVSICETIIADRLEARIQFLTHEAGGATLLGTAAQAAYRLLKIEPRENTDLHMLYSSVIAWSPDRNSVIHQFVKVAGLDQQLSAKERLVHAKRTAATGRIIMRSASNLVRKFNKY